MNDYEGVIMKKELIRKHFVSFSVLISVVLGIFLLLLEELSWGYGHFEWSGIASGAFIGLFCIYPFILTILNLFFLFANMQNADWNKKSRQIEYITVVLGAIYSALFVNIVSEISYKADWDVVLVNNQMHTPIWTQSYPTIITISIVGIVGYLFLSVVPVTKIPPLVTVLAMAAMYLGVVECILWMVQTMGSTYFVLCLFPFNCIILVAKTVRRILTQWKAEQDVKNREFRNKFLNAINKKLMNSATWPVAAFIMMWPLLGILIGILVLFGQQPDDIIKAWTETSDWNLSQRVAPQNVFFDEHYLCTVAAGGHKKIVKPLRLGQRHGHEVIVNRQLCVANAFEQVLEERTPRFHRRVRHFYDTYGFPIAKMIHSPLVADMIYFMMKPLECFFLLVLYLTDVNPENRIAMQYMPCCAIAEIQKCKK